MITYDIRLITDTNSILYQVTEDGIMKQHMKIMKMKY
jgi:hypothetical protein